MNSAAPSWTEWETTRCRLVLGGHVTAGGRQPIEGAEIVAELLAEGPTGKPRHAVEALATGGRHREKIQSTRSRADGSYYFLDLPAGEYRLTATGLGRKQEKQASLSADEHGIITPRYVDFSME